MFEGAFKFFHDGGPVMYPLLLASLVALTIVIERSLFHVRWWLGKDRKGLLDVLELIRQGRWEEARTRAEGTGDFLLNAVGTSLDEQGFQARGVFEMAHAEEGRRMNRYLMVLDTVITLAPLLGILGTVLGIIDSFDILGARGTRDPMAVTGGIARALITTAAGLSIAILTVIPFNFFHARTETSLNEIEEVATFLETYRARQGPGRTEA